MKSEAVHDAAELLKKIDPRTQVVGVDESNFFGPNLVDVASQLADTGKQVIIAGLDTDFMGRPFIPMPDLLAIAESITKTLAICVRCGNPAKHTQRLVESEDLIVVGAAGMYEARCRRCFEPGLPKQELLDFAGMNGEWGKWFPNDPPARQGAKLPIRPKGMKISIALIAEE